MTLNNDRVVIRFTWDMPIVYCGPASDLVTAPENLGDAAPVIELTTAIAPDFDYVDE